MEGYGNAMAFPKEHTTFLLKNQQRTEVQKQMEGNCYQVMEMPKKARIS